MKIAYYCLLASCLVPVLQGQAANEIIGSGYTGPTIPGVAPGDVITLFVSPLSVPDAVASQVPLPTTLSGVSVSVRATGDLVVDTTGYPTALPIFRIRSVNNTLFILQHTAITVQIPTEKVSTVYQGKRVPDFPSELILNVRANGVSGPDYTFAVNGITPHLLDSCDSVFGGIGRLYAGAPCHPVVTHADGTVVSFDSPAKAGETIVVYALGLGAFGLTGRPQAGPIALVNGETRFSYFSVSLLTEPTFQTVYIYTITPDYVGLVDGYVGLFQINLTVPRMPDGVPPCLNAADMNASIDALTLNGGKLGICVTP